MSGKVGRLWGAPGEGKVERYDVVIIGAGMVGSALGCALGQAGFRVALVDPRICPPFRADEPPDIRVSALSPATIEYLDSLGAWSVIKSMRLCPYRKMAVWEQLAAEPKAHNSKPMNRTTFDCREIGHEQLGYIVENNVIRQALHHVLLKQAKVELYSPALPAAFEEGEDGPSVRLDSGETLHAQLVVGADGADSLIRQQAGIGLSSAEYEQRALVATVEICSGPLDITWQAFTPTGPKALLPLPSVGGKHYASLVWYNSPQAVDDLRRLADEAFLEAVRRAFPPELPDIVRLLQRSSFALARRHAKRYFCGGAVLVGDAAHTVNPLAGQGVNLGFADAQCLGDLLIRQHDRGSAFAQPSVLRRYERARYRENLYMQMILDGFYHLFSNNITPVKLARNIGLAVAARFPFGRRQVMRYAMGIRTVGKADRVARRP